ncbi:chemotaxis protein CheD [Methanofollis aquaemaris]|uniref:Probable chemoreceptor glutamine deamidase CheD n=1 Tax=Methanofollis aquaemaris TaxID=126734 RepID=A0A8A3S3V2_9EURY|nr:chemotaxis protein CheD [Methanofollis aquaemaris]QSZ66284.1 chemotaxis protein CheD [Methanofollis aquaemaris]
MAEFRPIDVNARFIGIGEYYVGGDAMTTIGLGSCIALILHDERHGVGAMAHVMLPESKGQTDRPGKYADTALVTLLEGLGAFGSRNGSIRAKMVGGANMFGFNDNNLNIGERNIEAVHNALKEKRIFLDAEDVGGKVGRSVIYNPKAGGEIVVRRADGVCAEL